MSPYSLLPTPYSLNLLTVQPLYHLIFRISMGERKDGGGGRENIYFLREKGTGKREKGNGDEGDLMGGAAACHLDRHSALPTLI